MKKWFFESHITYVGMLLCIGSILCGCWLIKMGLTVIAEESAFFLYLSVLLLCYSIVCTVWLVVFRMWERQDWLLVTDESVTWRCLLKKTVQITYDDCQFIGVETFDKKAYGHNARGDLNAMVYLSLDPYPEEMSGYIYRLHCNERFIKFPYSDKLAETLLEAAPREKTYLLRAFYSQMQRYDQQQEQNRQRRKKRRK